MTDFFQSLSAIGDTLAKNRERSHRERTLADVGQYLSHGQADYKALGARLIAAGDIRNGILALRIGEMRGGFGRPSGAVADPSMASVLQEARDAIAQGKPRDAVIRRLQELRIDPSGL